MQQSIGYAYDRVLYPSYLHEQTHPDRLATIGTFFGMKPRPSEKCRVLELGCGTAGSLLSFALDLRDSEFVGVDLSERQIEFAEHVRREVGLDNLRLIHGDVMKLTRDELGEFDYIVAHGLFSWTPEPVRERILDICRQMLAPQGIAFISYNAYPGAHFRQIIREMMLFHTREIDDPEQKIGQARAVVKFITEGMAPDKPFKPIFDAELKTTLDRYSESIFHDDLSEINQPFYLYQFVEMAARHGLKYLADVQYYSGRDLDFPKNVLDTLETLGSDHIRRDQYIDFLNCRRFRQSLVCHAEVEVEPKPREDVLDLVLIRSRIRIHSENPDLVGDTLEQFVGPNDEKIQINHPFTKAALYHISQTWPRMHRLADIQRAARNMLEQAKGAEVTVSEEDIKTFRDVLFRIFGGGIAGFHLHEPHYCDHLSERPTASPLARWQAAHGTEISTLRHEDLTIEDPLALKLIQLLDGTRDQAQILDDMLTYIKSPELNATDEQRSQIAEQLPARLTENMLTLAKRGLLIA